MDKINVVWCYPDILNLHGDKGNIMALEKIGKSLGLEMNIIKVSNYSDVIDFENADIIFLGSGELRTIEPIINAFNEQKRELKKYIESNKVIVTIGAIGSIFSNRINRIDKGDLIGLEILDMNCYERKKVICDDLILKVKDTDMKLIGSQIQIMKNILNEVEPFAEVEYGFSDNGIDGARYKNLICTNLLGPLFVKNPWFTEYIIKLACKNKKIDIDFENINNEYDYEKKSFNEIKQYIDEK